MAARQRWYRFLGAGTLAGAVGLGAWSLGVEEPVVRSAPMEEILEEAAGIEGAVASLEWDLTVTRNERVETWIGFLAGRNAERTHLWLERSGRYAPMIRSELRERGMPQDLLYLALIESGFSPRASSRAAAVGIWQFIAETGQRYGLEVSDEVDERRDPIKATHAALSYLEDLYDRFGSWYLAAAAYNTGENRVDRILRERAGGARGSDSLFWKIAPYLPQETRDYVPLMLAAGHIAKSPADFGFDGLEFQEPLAFETVWVPGAVTFEGIARAANTTSETILDLNPHLVKQRTPRGRGWSVRIPTGRAEAFATRFPTIYREERARLANAPAESRRTHKVRRGETLSHIAVRYGVSVSALRAANDQIRPTRLRAGQSVTIPGGGAERARSAPRYHRVSSGENLTLIARRYGVKISDLRRWNGMGRRSLIKVGEQLRIGA